MTDREKLIEYIKQAIILHLDYLESIDQKGLIDTDGKAKFIADYLLANGVIVPPYKCGSKVYVLTSQTSNNRNFYIFEDIITRYVVTKDFTIMSLENHIGESSHKWGNVFLSREEAEKALAERSK